MDDEDLVYIVTMILGGIIVIGCVFYLYGEVIKTMFYTKEYRAFMTVFPYVFLICESLYLSYTLYSLEN